MMKLLHHTARNIEFGGFSLKINDHCKNIGYKFGMRSPQLIMALVRVRKKKVDFMPPHYYGLLKGRVVL